MPMVATASSVLRDGAPRLLRMRYVIDGITKKPHPEEPAQRASRRAHSTAPAVGLSFPACQLAAAIGRHRVDEALEQVMAVLRSGAGLGMVLHRKHRQVFQLQSLIAAVEQ